MMTIDTLTRLSVLTLVCGCAALFTATKAHAEIIDFASDRWVRPAGEVVEHMGRTCLIGSAYLPNIAFKNGVIEFDVALDGSRGFPGITFRATSPVAYEHLYLRPHAGLRNDGMQYAPAFGPGSDWQLYNGPGYTTSVEMPAGEWIHVRVEIKDRRARVFYGEAEEPALVITDLKHEPVAGAVGIRSTPDPTAHFSNFSVTKTDELDLGPEPQPFFPRGLVKEWEISRPFKATDVDASVYPDAALRERMAWRIVPTEPTGLLNLSRHVDRSVNGEADLLFARVFLEAEKAESRRFSFGYSDFVTVFLNGQPLFSGNGSYRSRSADYAGIISMEDALHLPLQRGRNELLFCLVETFGGWGLMGQDNDDDFFGDGLRELWRHEVGNRLPESVVHDPRRDVLYVTHYFRGGNEFISRVSTDGRLLEREWITGLNRPTGLVIHDDRLWVVDRQALVEIDIEAGAILHRHPIPEAGFPNDVAFADDGTAFVTDTRAHRIYRFRDGEFEPWLEGEEVRSPNGVLVDGDTLLFGTSDDGRLQRVDLAAGRVETVARLGDGANLDGLRADASGNYLVSDFGGRIFRVTPEGEVTKLLDTTASGARSADFEFVPQANLLVVPGLFDNRLTAYHYESQ
jgi:sugar lactone lactonase YvrE